MAPALVPVQVIVTEGRLGGDGVIGGPVTVGDGRGRRRAILIPSDDFGGIGQLQIQKRISFEADSTYLFKLDSNTGEADGLVAKGVSIKAAAVFSIIDLGNQTLPPGKPYFVIHNSGPAPISGSFSNLPDGSTITVRNNTFQANYEGGDGNDLTLTVVP